MAKQAQAQISALRLESKIGSVQQCMVDLIKDNIAVVRSRADAPEIDGLVHIQNGGELGLKVDELVDVEITDCDKHDLFGDSLPANTATQQGRGLNLQML